MSSIIGRQASAIKAEVRSEGVGWIVGSYLTRQLWSCLAFVPLFLAVILLRESEARQLVIWTSFGVWLVLNVFTLAVGSFFLSKRIDREFDRKIRPTLSKEYRKR